MNVKQAIELLRTVTERLQAYEDIAEINQDVARLKGNRDTLHTNIRREAEKEAEASSKTMLDEARARAKVTAQEAQEEAAKIIHAAQAKALQIVAEAETRARGLEEHIVVEKAKALLSSKAA
jgi:hypothetical protein